MTSRLAVAAAIAALAACAVDPGGTHTDHENFVPDAADQIATTDWDRARAAKVILLEYAFAPAEIIFREGASYRLLLTNVGDVDHYFSAPDFFRAIAVRGVELVPIGQPEWADVRALRRETAVAYRAGPEPLRISFKVAPLSAPAADSGADEPDNPFAAPSDEDEDDDADDDEAEEGTDSIFKFEQDDGEETVGAAEPGQPDDTAALPGDPAERSGKEDTARAAAPGRNEPTFPSAAADGGDEMETQQDPARGPARADADRPTPASDTRPPTAAAPATVGDDSDIKTSLRALSIEDDDSVHGIGAGAPPAASETAEEQPAAPAGAETEAAAPEPAAEETADDGEVELPSGVETFLRVIVPPAETEDNADLAEEDRRPADAAPELAEQPAKPDDAGEALAEDDADLPGGWQRPALSAEDVTADQEKARERAATAEAPDEGIAATAESVEEVVEEAEELVAEELMAEQAEDAEEPEQPTLGAAHLGAQPGERTDGESAGAVAVKPAPQLAAILVPARRSKVLYFVAVRTGTYALRSFGGADDILDMRGRIIIE